MFALGDWGDGVMGCETNLACQAIELVVADRTVAIGLIGFFDTQFGTASQWVQKNAEVIVGALGLSFGFWKWWAFREKILHKRLTEYIEREDRRLDAAHTQIQSAISRPIQGQHTDAPLFAVASLRSIFKIQNWEPVIALQKSEAVVDKLLVDAISQTRKRIELGEDKVRLNRRQEMQSHSIRAAIAAAQAGYISDSIESNRLDTKALSEINQALHVPGHHNDVFLLETKAHQLRRLGRLREAMAAYEALEAVVELQGPRRISDQLLARSKWCRAQIFQVIRLQQLGQGLVGSPRSRNANYLMQAESPANPHFPGALVIRRRHAPYVGWDLVEQGGMHLFAAYVAHIWGFNVVETTELTEAEVAYQAVLDETPKATRFKNRKNARLIAAARGGLEFVKAAKATQLYQKSILLPPCNDMPGINLDADDSSEDDGLE